MSCFISATLLTVSSTLSCLASIKPFLDFEPLVYFSFFSQKMHCFSYTRELEVLGFPLNKLLFFDYLTNRNYTFHSTEYKQDI